MAVREAEEDVKLASKRQRKEEATVVKSTSQATPDSHKSRYNPQADVRPLMPVYYGRLFPWKSLYSWLAYGNGDAKCPGADASFFQRRELCFTLDGDIFCRYQSFSDGASMAKAIRSALPSKIDIGPVFNVDPQRRNAYSGNGASGGKTFVPVERELVFDIDLTDYDDVRTCCSGGSICHKCWTFMQVAVKVLDAALREDFGFKHLLWVYSGRRGVHCWVCDERARSLTNEARSAVAEYLSVYKGVEKGRPKANVSMPLAPSLLRASDVLRNAWLKHVLPQQRLLDDESDGSLERVLSMISDDEVQETLRQRFRRKSAGGNAAAAAAAGGESVSVARWNEIEKEVMKATRRRPLLRKCLDEIVFAYSYPRLDIEVSKHRNHLLKAPFCIHPKTGRVCVPIDPERVDEFDPMDVPTLAQLLNELEENTVKNGGSAGSADGKLEDWKRTSMADAVNTFERTFLNGMLEECKEQLKAKAREAKAQPTLAW